MGTIIGIMDEDDWTGRTDVLIWVDANTRQWVWFPRDLWCESIQQRINAAYKRGGFDRLIACLAEHGVRADAGICVRRSASERMLANIRVNIPIEEELHFWYPAQPPFPVEYARKKISFYPPGERLTGERIHQWIGARKQVNGSHSDLDRIRRQQTFVRCLLEQQSSAFRVAWDGPDTVALYGEDPFKDVRHARADWSMTTFGPLRSVHKGDLWVQVKTRPWHPICIVKKLARWVRRALPIVGK